MLSVINFSTAVLSTYEFVYPAYMTSPEDSQETKAAVNGDLKVTKKENPPKKGVVLIGKVFVDCWRIWYSVLNS